MYTSESTETLSTTHADLDVLRQEVVDATIQLQQDTEAGRAVRTIQMIRLRQLLRELCLASGGWTRSLEASYQADIAALRKLGGLDVVRGQGIA